LHQFAFPLIAFFFAVTIPEALPATDTTSEEMDVVVPFDPTQTPPNAFEQQFGGAYYE
jgi:hypothetical protein